MSKSVNAELKEAFQGVSDNFRGTVDDPYPLYKKMRETSPVYTGNFMAELGVPNIAGSSKDRPTFTLFKHADVMRVMRDAKTFTSGFIAEGLGAFFDGLILTGMDGEAHKRARALLAPVFTPSTIRQWQEEKITPVLEDEFVKPLAASGKSAELIDDMGMFFPIRVIYALIGFPEDNPDEIKRFAGWAMDILVGPQEDPEKAKIAGMKAMAAAQALYDAMLPIVQKRREDGAKGTDLISRLIRLEEDGTKLDDHEITTFVRSLLPAAAETTTRTFGSAMALLLTNRENLEKVKADRSLILKVIDEAVRLEPTATFKIRQAAEDIEIGGVAIPKDAMVSCVVSSANRDEDVFDNADQFNPFRKQKPSFGFGFGTHMCIGLFVAKAEIESAMNALFDHMPNIRLDPAYPAPVMTGLQLRGPRAVHVIWD
ncbi:MAG: cytochrome P450 [Acidimicrobiales bacterium]|nr:cytochrome P450 [Hyphomonadaceae bacterium]RZV42692.1 MAG: cytochrome P450 [Acidimicrobiales bacterium]